MYEITTKLEGIEVEISLYENVKTILRDNKMKEIELLKMIQNDKENILDLKSDSEFNLFNPNTQILINCSIYTSVNILEIEISKLYLKVKEKTTETFKEVILKERKSKVA